jgi:hypothetical protein
METLDVSFFLDEIFGVELGESCGIFERKEWVKIRSDEISNY